jgi:hypothetical protein
MAWYLANPLTDVQQIVDLAEDNFGWEVEGILTRSKEVFRHRVTVAATEQVFTKRVRGYWAFAGLTGVGIRLTLMRRSAMPSSTVWI